LNDPEKVIPVAMTTRLSLLSVRMDWITFHWTLKNHKHHLTDHILKC